MSAAAASTPVNASTITVNGLGDLLKTDGVCTLREAIINANNDAATWPDCAAGSETDTINLPAGIIVVTTGPSSHPLISDDDCTTGDFDILSSLTINGHRDGTTIQGIWPDRIIDINPDLDLNPATPPPMIVVQINRLTITNGNQDLGGAGIRVNQESNVTISDSTISSNRSRFWDAGGIANSGTLTMRNSTISSNICGREGCGIKNEGILELISCTVTGNESAVEIYTGGIWNVSPGIATLKNTIVAANLGANFPNVKGDFVSGGYNIIGDFGTNPPIAPNTGDQLDVIDASVQLGLLAANGGPTMTHALAATSIAIDQGNSFGLTTDQRGFTRPCDKPTVVNAPAGLGADVGAFEVQGPCLNNTAPVAVNDLYNIDQDTLLNASAPGVLGNDTDVDGDSLIAELVSGPSHAMTFVLNANGSFSYNPVAHFTGVDSFTYTANDGTDDSAVATVTINIADTEPPHITAAVGVGTLWAPNHNLINVGLTANVTDNSAGPITTDIGVFSNEDDLFQGSGNASPDARNIAAQTLLLRSERSGNGSGRIYLIRLVANDPSNNVSRKCLSVVVPKSESAADISFINTAAAVARAFCENTGTPPAGYFVVGDGPVINPLMPVGPGKVRGRVSVAGTPTDSVNPLPQESVTNNRLVVATPFLIARDERLSVKEYDEFNRVLQELDTEPWAKKNDLLQLGDAIVKLGVPTATKADQIDALKNQLANFRKVLDEFRVSPESSASLSAVKNSFQALARMLP